MTYSNAGVDNYVHTQDRIYKKFEAEGRTDWKNEMKKAIKTSEVQFFTQKLSEDQKRDHRDHKCPFFH